MLHSIVNRRSGCRQVIPRYCQYHRPTISIRRFCLDALKRSMQSDARNLLNGGSDMSKVWLVTGSASGLGRDIAEAVLASGDRLLAKNRDPQRLNDLVERYGEQVSTAF